MKNAAIIGLVGLVVSGLSIAAEGHNAHQLMTVGTTERADLNQDVIQFPNTLAPYYVKQIELENLLSKGSFGNAIEVKVAQSTPACGGEYPVIFQQNVGFFNYRWCASSTENFANRDVYTVQNGRFYYHYSNLVSCTDPALPSQVAAQVCT